MPGLADFFEFSLSQGQLYGVFFLLGSFAVASLSDLRRLSAQREFLEVWGFFTLVMLALEFYLQDFAFDAVTGIKWGLMVLLAALSWEKVGGIFRLAIADVAACLAVASLLAPGYIVGFWILLKLSDFVVRPMLPRFGSSYPFMPVVTAATVLILGLAWYAGPLLARV